MNADEVFFSAASETEELAFGSSRPGYPSRSVSAATVLEWVAFMKEQGIDRVVCLLPDIQLRSYGGLLQTYRDMFGEDHVCWVPIPDFTLPNDEQLLNEILPFLKLSVEACTKIVVHCSAGIGRTGFVLAAFLVSFRGYTPEEAIKVVALMGRDACESGDPRVREVLNLCREAYA